MGYDFAAYQADRTALNFMPMVEITPKGLSLRRRRMLSEQPGDAGAINAAYDRLLAWLESGAPEPQAPPPADTASQPRPGAKALAEAIAKTNADEKASWEDALAAQRARHARRRSRYPALAPQAARKD